MKILRDAMAKTFNDPGFREDFKKLMGREPTPLTGEEVEKAIRELPRDPEVIALYKKLPCRRAAAALNVLNRESALEAHLRYMAVLNFFSPAIGDENERAWLDLPKLAREADLNLGFAH